MSDGKLTAAVLSKRLKSAIASKRLVATAIMGDLA